MADVGDYYKPIDPSMVFIMPLVIIFILVIDYLYFTSIIYQCVFAPLKH